MSYKDLEGFVVSLTLFIGILSVYVWFTQETVDEVSYKNVQNKFELVGHTVGGIFHANHDRVVGYRIRDWPVEERPKERKIVGTAAKMVTKSHYNDSSRGTWELITGYSVYKIKSDLYRIHPYDRKNNIDVKRVYKVAQKGSEIAYEIEVARERQDGRAKVFHQGTVVEKDFREFVSLMDEDYRFIMDSSALELNMDNLIIISPPEGAYMHTKTFRHDSIFKRFYDWVFDTYES